MSDYIKREDAEQIMYSYGIGGTMFVDDLLKPSKSEEARQKEVWEMVRNVLDRVAVKNVAPVRHGHWIIKCVREYDLSYGGMAYVPEYECSCCGNVTESYVRLDEPIMPDDADFPKYCEDCGARMDWKDLDRWKDEQKAKGEY